MLVVKNLFSVYKEEMDDSIRFSIAYSDHPCNMQGARSRLVGLPYFLLVFNYMCETSSAGNVAIKLSRPARSSSEMARPNSCSNRRRFIAFSQQERLAHRYAPRPDFLPVASMRTCPSGVRTTRNNSRFDFVSRQEMQVRNGMCFCFFGCLLATFAIYASSYSC